MSSVEKKYIITKQMKFDFQIVLIARNEKEAAYCADLKEIELWTEVDSNWMIIDVTRVSHLVLVEDKKEQETRKPVIKIWGRT
jgi:hypothetical protein